MPLPDRRLARESTRVTGTVLGRCVWVEGASRSTLLTELRTQSHGGLTPSCDLQQAMRDRIFERSASQERGTRVMASAAIAASTFVLALPMVLPAIARARASVRRGTASYWIAPHGAAFSSHKHHIAPSYPADLTVLAAGRELSSNPLRAISAVQPHERLAPATSARGPPSVSNNP
jgi:hypothetical protein